ncbi:MAG: hypothetical protein HKO83_05965 [Ignavibacteriaceae bacterium]|nr:hypothetical protein [Ignavibacteria bacterium]NNL20850.1 hypothetical protein [Ignavibacteriaceae bacterium]
MKMIQWNMLYVLLMFCGLTTYSFAQQITTDLRALSKGADVIVVGKVTQQVSSWNEDKTRIYTRATLQINDYVKGNNSGNSVIVKYLGGEVGEIGEKYSHMPRFEDEEEVLVFLMKDEKSTDYKVYNGENGKIRVINDSKTGEKVTPSNVQVNSLKAQIKNYIND